MVNYYYNFVVRVSSIDIGNSKYKSQFKEKKYICISKEGQERS